MTRRNQLGKKLVCIGAAIIISSVAWDAWKYFLPNIQYFIKNLPVLSDYNLPGYNRFGNSGLAYVIANLLRSSVLIVVSIIVIKCIRYEKNRLALKICACFLFGFDAPDIWMTGFGTVYSALSVIGTILIALGSLLLITKQNRGKTCVERSGTVITDISAMLLLFYAGHFTRSVLLSVATFGRDEFLRHQAHYGGNAAAMVFLGMCLYMVIGLTMLYGGRHHFYKYKKNYNRAQLRFGVAVFLIHSMTLFLFFGRIFNERFFYWRPDIRYILLLLSPLYLIGALLLSISARRSDQHEIKITEDITEA